MLERQDTSDSLILARDCDMSHDSPYNCSYVGSYFDDDDDLVSIPTSEDEQEAYIPRWEDIYYESQWWRREKQMIQKLIYKIEYFLDGLGERAEWHTKQKRLAMLRLIR